MPGPGEWELVRSVRRITPADLARAAAISDELIAKANAARQRMALIPDDEDLLDAD
jgi:hypothetical protein